MSTTSSRLRDCWVSRELVDARLRTLHALVTTKLQCVRRRRPVEVVRAELKSPFDHLLHATRTTEFGAALTREVLQRPRGPVKGPRGLSIESLVGERGLEPPRTEVH